MVNARRHTTFKLNTSKTEILLLGTRQNTRDLSPVSVRVGGEIIQESLCVKNLGVLFDRHLTWDAHVSDVVRKCVGLLIGSATWGTSSRSTWWWRLCRAWWFRVWGIVCRCMGTVLLQTMPDSWRLWILLPELLSGSGSTITCLARGTTLACAHLAKCVMPRRQSLRIGCAPWESRRISPRSLASSPMQGHATGLPGKTGTCVRRQRERRPDGDRLPTGRPLF